MEKLATIDELSLLGGPLHRLGRRIGLVRGGTNPLLLGVAIGAFLWAVLFALTLIEGISDKFFSLSVIGVHVRLLVAIPLFFLCEASVDPRMSSFVRTIMRSNIVPRNALPTLKTLVARTNRWNDSWFPEVICLLAALLLSFLVTKLGLSGIDGSIRPAPRRE